MKKPVKKPSRQELTQQRRALIIDSAMACFVEAGIAETGVRDIAKRADVSLGNLYNHFRGKTALIAEIARLESQGLAEIVGNTDDIDDCFAALKLFTDQLLDYSAGLYPAVLTVEITAMALRNPKIATLFDENRKLLIGCIIAILQRGKDQGKIATALDIAPSADIILDLVEATGLRIGLMDRTATPREISALHALITNAVRLNNRA